MSGQAMNFIVSTNNDALFSSVPAITSAGDLSYAVAPDANGLVTVTVKLKDDGGTANGGVDTSAQQTFTIQITAVNDAPSFAKGGNQSVLEDAGPQTVSAWATNISQGPANESGQVLDFVVTTDNDALFSALPVIDTAGNLTYTPAADANGSATVTVRLHDDGGTANGGQDTSTAQTFTITVTAVNDIPSFVRGGDQIVDEDAGPQSITAWATNISAGPANENGQTLSFEITSNSNPGLFAAGPTVTRAELCPIPPRPMPTGSPRSRCESMTTAAPPMAARIPVRRRRSRSRFGP